MAVAPTTITLGKGQWTCLNSASAAAGAVSIYPVGAPIWLKSGVDGTTAPTNMSGAIELRQSPGGVINQTIAQLWPGTTNTYLWAYCYADNGSVAVSCA